MQAREGTVIPMLFSKRFAEQMEGKAEVTPFNIGENVK